MGELSALIDLDVLFDVFALSVQLLRILRVDAFIEYSIFSNLLTTKIIRLTLLFHFD